MLASITPLGERDRTTVVFGSHARRIRTAPVMNSILSTVRIV